MSLHLSVSSAEDPKARVFAYEFDNDRSQILLGRRGGVDVLLPSPRVSLIHARIERRGTEFFLVDAGSTNGTELNGRTLAEGEAARLANGDRIRVATFEIGVTATDLSPAELAFPEPSAELARKMVRDVFDRLGDERGQPTFRIIESAEGANRRGDVILRERGRAYMLGFVGDELRLDDIDAWQPHCAIESDATSVTLRDVGSPGALLVNDVRIRGARRLKDGDRIVLDGATLQYADPAEAYLVRLGTAQTPDESGATLARPVRGVSFFSAMIALGIACVALSIGALAWLAVVMR